VFAPWPFPPTAVCWRAGVGDPKTKGEVAVWDAKTLKVQLVHPVEHGVASVAFSPDSKTLAVGSYGEDCYLLGPRYWQREGGSSRAMQRVSRSVAFAPSGDTLAIGGLDQLVHVWDWRGGKRTHTLKGHTDEVYLVAYSPDGKVLASSGTRGSTCLWEAATGKLLHQWERGTAPVAFDPKGRWLATAGNDSSVTLRDLQDYQKTSAFIDGIFAYRCLSIHPSGRTFAACAGRDVVNIFSPRPWPGDRR